MRPSYMGKILLHWCDACHVPVLSARCGCGAPAREVPITPPGDARPAFPYDIALVNRIFHEHFGSVLLPPGHLVLLNKVPDKDRMEEIVVGGGIVGSVRYISGERRWEPIPRPEASQLMKPTRRYVVVDEGAVSSIRDDGASVLAPGLIEIEQSVRKGDEVFIFTPSGTCIGVGRAKVDAQAARELDRGAIVRTRKNVRSLCISGEATWDGAVGANLTILHEREAEAIRFVQDVRKRNPIPVNISYSGGKDSLATLLVVLKAIGKVPLLFADTGLEFPETYQNINRIADQYGLEVVRSFGTEEFWNTFSSMGPPAVDFRWCCRACKLNPLKSVIRERWGECVSFIGQRKFESFRRMTSRRVFRNSHVGIQLSAAPIHHWAALHVWLYLFAERAPYNPLYEEGLDRIGCYMCPSSDLAVLESVAARYPALWTEWTQRLRDWQSSNGLSDEWVGEGRWRIRGACADEADSDC